MAVIVWTLFGYCGFTVLLLAQQGDCPIPVALVHTTLCTLAFACHVKTMGTDPGSIPSSAVPLPTHHDSPYHIMCSLCQSYKPYQAHHCRICNRCVARMDHHCPWMNNCIGAANLKHFILFLTYTWMASALSLILFAVNYFYCNHRLDEAAQDDASKSLSCPSLNGLELLLVRTMTVVCVAAMLFTTSMLSSVVYGIYTGIGTIDRLKRKATNTWHDTTEPPVHWRDILGIGSYWMWLLPTDPVFHDYDQIMGCANRQRLLRRDTQVKEQQYRLHGDVS